MGIRVIAVDWSGALVAAQQKIWLAEVVDGHLVRLENGRDRPALTDHLIEQAERDPQVVVGLDFAFSLPAWYLKLRGLASAQDLWALADREADAWLAACEWPFWGRPGVPCPKDVPARFRQTELDVPKTAGIQPKSVFQVGGAGAVGTGSLRGMRTLHRLHAAGFSVWPFDPPGWPRVVEIYPRVLTGKVNKSSASHRAAYLAAHYPDLDGDLLLRAASSDDAFDAAVSALVMADHTDELTKLPAAANRQTLLEGLIWHPASAASVTVEHIAEGDRGRGPVTDPGHPDFDPTEGGQYPTDAPTMREEVFGGTVWAPDGTIVYDYLEEQKKRRPKKGR